jgi:hypothetical protein
MTPEQTREKLFDVIVANIWQLWGLYIKFYVFANTVNIAAFGLAVQYINSKQRVPLVIVFAILNVLLVITSISISIYTQAVAKETRKLLNGLVPTQDESNIMNLKDEDFSFSIPGTFLAWAGYANAIGSTVLIVCWIAALWIEKPFLTN